MLTEIKLALRITSSAYDDEISSIIEACKLDLKLAGVTALDELNPDALIVRAITLYAKANFGFNSDSEKYQRSYDMLKTSLSLAGDYNLE